MRRLFTKRQKKIMQLYSGNFCQQCGVKLPKNFHGDHIKPFSKGGQTVNINGQALCGSCNCKKGNQ